MGSEKKSPEYHPVKLPALVAYHNTKISRAEQKKLRQSVFGGETTKSHVAIEGLPFAVDKTRLEGNYRLGLESEDGRHIVLVQGIHKDVKQGITSVEVLKKAIRDRELVRVQVKLEQKVCAMTGLGVKMTTEKAIVVTGKKVPDADTPWPNTPPLKFELPKMREWELKPRPVWCQLPVRIASHAVVSQKRPNVTIVVVSDGSYYQLEHWNADLAAEEQGATVLLSPVCAEVEMPLRGTASVASSERIPGKCKVRLSGAMKYHKADVMKSVLKEQLDALVNLKLDSEESKLKAAAAAALNFKPKYRSTSKGVIVYVGSIESLPKSDWQDLKTAGEIGCELTEMKTKNKNVPKDCFIHLEIYERLIIRDLEVKDESFFVICKAHSKKADERGECPECQKVLEDPTVTEEGELKIADDTMVMWVPDAHVTFQESSHKRDVKRVYRIDAVPCANFLGFDSVEEMYMAFLTEPREDWDARVKAKVEGKQTQWSTVLRFGSPGDDSKSFWKISITDLTDVSGKEAADRAYGDKPGETNPAFTKVYKSATAVDE